VIRELNAEPLAFVAHVGDIAQAGRCDDAWLEARKRQFETIRQPFVLLPGDNEWTDCHRTGFDPLERLAKWRSLFCWRVPEIGLERQPGERCEHARWQVGSVLYVALNVPGSNNNLGRTPQMDAEHARRMDAVFAWLEEGFALADARRLSGTVILMQANPFEGAVRRPRGAPDGYERLREYLRAQAARGKRALLLVNGDTHTYRDDRPLPGLRRVEVFGAPHVRWLRATVVRGGFLIEPAPQARP
jgi:hypothetical protein